MSQLSQCYISDSDHRTVGIENVAVLKKSSPVGGKGAQCLQFILKWFGGGNVSMERGGMTKQMKLNVNNW